MTDEDTQVAAPDTVLEGLAAENQLLKTWVIGLVTECEGCAQEAQRWVEAIQPITQFRHADD
jgi:nicotinic acid phosphoribosyltransferase